MSVKELLYHNLPVWLQNGAVSLEGWRLHRLRYGGMGRRLKKLMDDQWLSGSALGRMQNEELRKLVAHCAVYVPYYKELFSRLNISPEDIKMSADIKRLPVLKKETLKEDRESFIARNTGPAYDNYTSGTTGTPLTIRQDAAGIKRY